MYHSRLRMPEPWRRLSISRSNSTRGRGMAPGQIQPCEAIDNAFADTRQGFAGGTDHGFGDSLEGALRRRIEGAQAVDLVAEQLDAHRTPDVRGPDVNDTAAPAELARRLNDRCILVPQPDPARQHAVKVEGLTLTHDAQRQPHLSNRQGHLHQAAGRSNGHRCEWGGGSGSGPREQSDQRFKAALPRLGSPGDAFVGQRIGIHEVVDRHFVREPDAQFVDPLTCGGQSVP